MESVAGATTEVAEEKTPEGTEIKNDENTRVRWAKKLIEHKGTVGTGKLQAAVKAKFGRGIPPQRLAEVFGKKPKTKTTSSASNSTPRRKKKKAAKGTKATVDEAVAPSPEESTLDLSDLSMDQACRVLRFLLASKGRHFDLVIGNGTQTLRRS